MLTLYVGCHARPEGQGGAIVRMHRIRLTLVIVGLGLASVALAENVYKCTDKDGAVVYQRERCEDARQVEEKRIDPNKNVVQWEPPPASSSSASSAPSASAPSPNAPAPNSAVRKRRGAY